MLIGELATTGGTSARTLRYYEEQGLLSPGRTANGYRVYDADAPLTVRRIRALLDAGFGSVQIRELLPCVHDGNLRIQLCRRCRPRCSARSRPSSRTCRT